jgi:hypothetical protein
MVLIGLLSAASPARAAEKARWIFDTAETGTLPSGFVVATGHWRVVAHDHGKVLTQLARNANTVFNVVLIRGHDAQDLDLSVKLRPVAGVNDQGGGLIWRAKDAKNYYLARFNPLENNFRVYTVVDGKRTQLQSADASYPGAWCHLRVNMKGDHIACFKDGVKLLDVHDSTFPGPGQIGLWSKSDAQTEFDELELQGPEGESGK